MEPYEYWIACLIAISFLAALLEIIFASTKSFTLRNEPLAAVVLAIFTAIMHFVTARQWRKTAMHRKGTQTPQVILSVTLCIFNCLFAVTWFVISIVLYVFVSKLEGPWDDEYPHHTVMTPAYAWVIAFLAYIISGLTWAQFGLCVYYRRRFFKHSQSPHPPNPQYKMLLEKHTKWILGLIIVCMILCFIEFGFSFGDGAYGGYSIWLIPVAVFLTEVVHLITLPVWKYTVKHRRGTINPPFIYSMTLCVLTSLLALFWFIASIISFLTASSRFYNYKYISWSVPYGNYRVLSVVRWMSASLALLISCMMFAEFGLIVYYRQWFLKRVGHARNLSQSTADHTTTKTGQINQTVFNNVRPESVSNPNAYAGMYQPPVSTPGSPYIAPYAVQQQQQQQVYFANTMASPNLVHNPVHQQIYTVQNPVFQPSSPAGTVLVHSMFQKDEGK
ncbi:hypothetical protein FRC19_010658 [Serendipita sp. 401]|nr:hypothetical protein FRC19_010658 [Serendipita sp. 401]